MQFLEGHTTFVTIVESKEDSQMADPTIFLCHDYGVSSAYQKYDVTSAEVYDYVGYEQIPDISGKTKWDIYQEFNFLADLDFEFYFRINKTHQQRFILGTVFKNHRKKYHSTLRAERATFTFRVDKS